MSASLIRCGRRRAARALARDTGGVAFVEFAYALPMFLTLMLGGVELTHYVTTKMRVSQLALHIADHAARIGSGSLLAEKRISETQINDLFTGANLQSGELNLAANGRVILSSLEPQNNPNPQGKYRIVWQRCYGAKAHSSSHGRTGDSGMNGIGPAGRQVTAPDNSATMFVEVRYDYRPIIARDFAPTFAIVEIASMAVRDRRDLTRIYNSENALVSRCDASG